MTKTARNILLSIMALAFWGCAPTYSVPDKVSSTATLNFVAHPKAKATEIYIFKITPQYRNNVNNATIGQQSLAHFSGSGVSSKKIQAGTNFRILIRQVKMYGVLSSVCDTVVGFRPQRDTVYQLEAFSDMDSTSTGRCSAKLYRITGKNHKTTVKPNEYSTVAN